MSVIVKSKRQLTPSINHTKTTIAKSTPFLIRRHHLDDSQMKKALRYEETIRQQSGRTYSYQGEKITYKNYGGNSAVKPSQPLRTPISTQIKQANIYEYYNSPDVHHAQTAQDVGGEREMPYFRDNRQLSGNSPRQASKFQCSSYNPNYQEVTVNRNREVQRLARQMKEKEARQAREMQSMRDKMEKEARKLRKMHKKKVEKDINRLENNQVYQLEQQIRQLKIQALEAEKQKLAQELSQTVAERNHKHQKVDSAQNIVYTRGQLILNKPKYRPKPSTGEDTDSSFSSFEFN